MFGKLNVQVGADLSDLRKKMGQVGGIVKGGADKMKSVGKGITKGVTVPLGIMGAAAVKAQMDFESAFTGVQKTVDGTPEQMDALRDGIRGMSREIPVAATRIAGVAEAAGQLGIKTPAIMEFSRTMVDLGEASDLGPDEAAKSLARLANITGMPQTEFDRLGATVVALGNNLATTESEITEMGQRLAGAGSQVGLAESEILGLAGTLSSVGIRAEAGGSAFSKLLLDIQNAVQTGSAELGAFAGTAGMTAGQFADAFERDASGALTRFIEGLGRVQTEGGNVSAVFESIGVDSVRSRDALLRTAGAGDLLADSLALGAQGWAENTALSEEAAKRYATLTSRLTVLWNRLVDVGVEIGDVLSPVVGSLIDGLEPLFALVENLARAFGNLPGPIQKIAVGFGVALAATGPLLVALGSLPAITSAVTAGFGLLSGTALPAVTSAFGTAWAAATGPVAAVVAGVGAVAASVYAIYQNWESVSGFFSNLWSSVLDVVEGFAKAHLGALKAIWPAAKTVFLKGIEGLMGPLKRFADWIGADSLAGSISGFQDQLDGLVPRRQMGDAQAAIREGVAQMGKGISDGAGTIRTAGADLVGAAGDVAIRIKDKIAGAFTAPDDNEMQMEGSFGGGGELDGDAFSLDSSMIENLISDESTQKATALAEKLSDTFSGLSQEMRALDGQARAFGTPLDAATGKVRAIKGAVTDLITAGLDPSTQAVQRLLGKLSEARASVMDLRAAPVRVEGAEMGDPMQMLQERKRQHQEFVNGLDLTKRVEVPANAAAEKLEASRERIAQASNQIGQTVEAGFTRAATGMLAGIGQMATGQKSLGGVVKGVVSTLADMAIRVGKIAIGTGIAIEGIKRALQSLNPVAAIAAGGALIALGAAVKGALSSAASGGSGGSGVGGTARSGRSYTANANDQDRRDPPNERRSESETPITVNVQPRVLPAGDTVYAQEEGRRRVDSYGTDRQ